MKVWRTFSELTGLQKELARNQYSFVEEETDDLYGRCETCARYGRSIYCDECNEGSEYVLDMSDQVMSQFKYKIDTDNESYVFIEF